MKHVIVGAAALLASLAAYPAAAGNVRFFITNGEDSATWLLPQTPSPDYADELGFDIDGPVDAGADGLPALIGNFSFYTAGGGGGFEADLLAGFGEIGIASSEPFFFHFNLFGDQLFTGATSAPTFKLGEFDLEQDSGCGCEGVFGASAIDNNLYHLTISSAAPEPAGWAIMIAGFGGAGVALRRRRPVSA